MNLRFVVLPSGASARARSDPRTSAPRALTTRSALLGLAAIFSLPAPAHASVWPTSGWPSSTPAAMGMDPVRLGQARDYAISHGGGSGLITRGGRVVLSWGSTTSLYELKSATKSVGAVLLGMAVRDGLVRLSDRALDHDAGFGVPPAANQSTGWLDDITLQMLATHTAGFNVSGGFTGLIHPPGTVWDYSDGGVNWLADVLTLRYGQDLHEVLTDRVLVPMGLSPADLSWRDNIYRGTTIQGIPRRELGSGIAASVDAMARLGYLHLRRGTWNGTAVFSSSYAVAAGSPVQGLASLPEADSLAYPGASSHYGLLWWNNGDGAIPGVPTDACWAWGMGEAIILVIPSLEVVAARAGDAWQPDFTADYSVLALFFTHIVQSVVGPPSNHPPFVSAGLDRTAAPPQTSVALDGSTSDDDLPSGTLTSTWTKISGPGQVTFSDKTALDPTATFTSEGAYVLRLTVSDGALTASDDVRVTLATPSPTAYWTFDEGSGTLARSSAGPGYTGTLTNGALWGAGKWDRSVELDGVDDWVVVSDPGAASALDLKASFTIASWVRFDALPSTGTSRYPRIAQKGARAGNPGSYQLSVATSGTPVLSLEVLFGGARTTLYGVQGLSSNRWYHVAAVKQGTSIRLYVDGIQDGPAHTVPSGAPDQADEPLYIGASPLNSDGSLDGRVDDLRIYGAALTQAQVQSLSGSTTTAAPVAEESVETGLRVQGSTSHGGAVALVIRAAQDGLADLEIFDVHGRRVKRLLNRAPLLAGSSIVTWDGSTDSGPPSASGVYFARLRIGGESAVARVTILR